MVTFQIVVISLMLAVYVVIQYVLIYVYVDNVIILDYNKLTFV